MKAPSRKVRATSSADGLDFFILFDGQVATSSVKFLTSLLEKEGYSVDSLASNPQGKGYLKAGVVILYLTDGVLENKTLVDRYVAAVRKNRKVVMVSEADESSGAKLKRRSRKSIDIEMMKKNDIPKARAHMQGVGIIPFRKETSFAKHAVSQLLSSCNFSTGHLEVDSWHLAGVKAQKFSAATRKWVFDHLTNWKEKPVLAITGSSGTGKSILISEYATRNRDYTALHIFDPSNELSRDGKTAIHSIASQLYNLIPQFQSQIANEWETIPEIFKKLVLEPAHAVKKTPGKKPYTIALDGINSCKPEHQHAFLHAIQSARFPSWLRILITGTPDVVASHDMGNKMLTFELDSKDSMISDLLDYSRDVLAAKVRDHELETVVTNVMQRCKGDIFYLSLLESWSKDQENVTIDSLPATKYDLYVYESERLIERFGGSKSKYVEVIQLILASRVPIPMSILRQITDVGTEELNNCGLLEVVGHGVQVYNKSVRKWLISKKNKVAKVSVREGHSQLADFCLSCTPKEVPTVDSESPNMVSDESEQQFALLHSIYHLCQIESFDKVEELMTNLDWLLHRVKLSPYSIVNDCQEYYKAESSSSAVLTVTAAVRNCTAILQREYRELPGQLIARIPVEKADSSCKALLEQCKNFRPHGTGHFWRPLRSSMYRSDILINREVVETPTSTEVNACAVSNNGAFLASAKQDGTISIYNSPTFELLKVFRGHKAGVTSVDFSPSNDKLASASDDSTAIIWDVFSGKKLHILKCGVAPLYDVKFSNNGAFLVGGTSIAAKVWDTNDGKLIQTYSKEKYGIFSVNCSAVHASTFAAGYQDGRILLHCFDEAEGEPQILSGGHRRSVTALVFSAEHSELLVSGSYDRNICIWNIDEMKVVTTIKSAHSGKISDLSCNAEMVLSCSLEDNALKSWNIESGLPISVVRLNSRGIRCCRLFADNPSLALVGSNDHTLRVCDISESQLAPNSIDSHTDWITAMAVNPVAPEIATGSWDGTIRFWSTKTGELLKTITPKEYSSNPFVFSKDGKFILSMVGAWHTDTGERAVYANIPESIRNPIEHSIELHGENLPGYENMMDTPGEGFGFSSDSADMVIRRLLPVNEHRERPLGVMISGNAVHILELVESK